MAAEIGKLAGTSFSEASNHFEAQGAQDGACWTSGALNSVAASLMKIANDVRLMNSGPRCGLAEVALPAIQPGSSIMPGKVNPVVCEAVTMVAAQVMGHHVAITVGAQWGQLDLNVMLPMMAKNLLESIQLLAAASRVFADKALAGLVANADTCREYIEISPSMATALNPLIGYDKAAEIAKAAHKRGTTLREEAVRLGAVSEAEFDRLVRPEDMVGPKR
jgi:fumarate hydratase class II